eukprot:TRINITY_DN23228_c0_g5_i1.p1 TRINITY_DN23228_c0_g5~~TRINITY_DN23228_c0_g5_i1.p1  ORF type:complete len:555 (+),score=51.40 TRINITY_DN23228_c0_g5_i1:245-1666(+)
MVDAVLAQGHALCEIPELGQACGPVEKFTLFYLVCKEIDPCFEIRTDSLSSWKGKVKYLSGLEGIQKFVGQAHSKKYSSLASNKPVWKSIYFLQMNRDVLQIMSSVKMPDFTSDDRNPSHPSESTAATFSVGSGHSTLMPICMDVGMPHVASIVGRGIQASPPFYAELKSFSEMIVDVPAVVVFKFTLRCYASLEDRRSLLKQLLEGAPNVRVHGIAEGSLYIFGDGHMQLNSWDLSWCRSELTSIVESLFACCMTRSGHEGPGPSAARTNHEEQEPSAIVTGVNFAHSLLATAQMHAHAGKHEAVKEIVSRIPRHEPETFVAQGILGISLLRAGSLEKASIELRCMVDLAHASGQHNAHSIVAACVLTQIGVPMDPSPSWFNTKLPELLPVNVLNSGTAESYVFQLSRAIHGNICKSPLWLLLLPAEKQGMIKYLCERVVQGFPQSPALCPQLQASLAHGRGVDSILEQQWW